MKQIISNDTPPVLMSLGFFNIEDSSYKIYVFLSM